MRAHVGDHLIVESPTTGAARRGGGIVGVHHNDGTPPYDVRWSDSGRVCLVFPGPDAHIHHTGHPDEPAPAAPARRTAARPSAEPPSDAQVAALARDASTAPSMHNAQ